METIKTIFDLGEAGYMMYHYFYLQWRKENEETPPPIQIFTLPDRTRVYERNLANIIRTDLPEELLDDSLVRNSFLYNNMEEIPFEYVMKACKVNKEEVVSPWKNLDWKNYKWYGKKQLIKPFVSHDFEIESYNKMKNEIDKSKKNIVLFPRYKKGSNYMLFRNWSFERWDRLIKLLVDETDFNVIICGKKGQTFPVKHYKGRTLGLVTKDPFPMIITALNDDNTILTACSQSFGGKLSLLQNVDTIMWGHQRHRHQVEENWSGDNTVCSFIEDEDYIIYPEDVFEIIKHHLKVKEEEK